MISFDFRLIQRQTIKIAQQESRLSWFLLRFLFAYYSTNSMLCNTSITVQRFGLRHAFVFCLLHCAVLFCFSHIRHFQFFHNGLLCWCACFQCSAAAKITAFRTASAFGSARSAAQPDCLRQSLPHPAFQRRSAQSPGCRSIRWQGFADTGS